MNCKGKERGGRKEEGGRKEKKEKETKKRIALQMSLW